MKKLITILTVYLITATSSKVAAQNNLIARNDKPVAGFSATLPTAATGTAILSDVVSKSISKKFAKEFGSIDNAVRTKDNNGFVVRFTTAGIQNWAYLTSNGTCYGKMRYYAAKYLPASVGSQVAAAYSGFEITSAKEVHFNKKTAYLVTIANADSWKVIQVVDDKMGVWEEHDKG